tara:strand:- start:7896 stop:8147 length:252 start_codon:yes stop_codon:yes gene_type:complete
MGVEILPPDIITWMRHYQADQSIKIRSLSKASGIKIKSLTRRLDYQTKMTMDEMFLLLGCLGKLSGKDEKEIVKRCLEETGKI